MGFDTSEWYTLENLKGCIYCYDQTRISHEEAVTFVSDLQDTIYDKYVTAFSKMLNVIQKENL